MNFLFSKVVSSARWFLNTLFPLRAFEIDSGRLNYEDGTAYVGEHKDGLPEGQGKYLMPNGDQVEGLFHRGLVHGPCLLTYADGGYFSGSIKNRRIYDQSRKTRDDSEMLAVLHVGKRVFPDGSVYIGRFKNGQLHGKGEFTEVNGERWIGRFKNGKPDGRMTVFYHQGWKYKGRFENGIAVGKAKMTSPEGITEVVDSSNQTTPIPKIPAENKEEKDSTSGKRG
jgi:hypothetical protein